MRVEKLKQEFEVETVLVHFPLHPDTPLEGRSMAEFYASRNIDPEAAYARMKGLMDAEGLPYGRRTHTYNSRLAQELGKWTDTQPGGAARRPGRPAVPEPRRAGRRPRHSRRRQKSGRRSRHIAPISPNLRRSRP